MAAQRFPSQFEDVQEPRGGLELVPSRTPVEPADRPVSVAYRGVMDEVFRCAAAALGATTVALASMVEPVVRSSHLVLYHWDGAASTFFGPILLDFLVVWTVLTILLLSASSLGRWRVAVWAGLILTLPWVIATSVSRLWPHPILPGFHLPRCEFAIAAWVLLLLFWRPTMAARFETVVKFATTVLGFLGLIGGFFVIQMVLGWWAARSLNTPAPLHHRLNAAVGPVKTPRIIWIVLDELSYQQVYERRYPGLELPAFDQLAAQSTVFTHTVPAGIHTENVLPSLFTGKTVDEISSSMGGLLSIHETNPSKWRKFQPTNTVFQDALNAGYETGVAGWWNPYCRIMPAVLDSCYWTLGSTAGNGLSSDGTFWSNWRDSLARDMDGETMRHLLNLAGIPAFVNHDQELHIQDFQRLSEASDSLLNDRSKGFVLLHMPVPHPGGIYDRATGQLTTGKTSYVDNLALADRYLAHVRSLLQNSGQWDTSTVVVMGDHGWRTKLVWQTDPTWTKEDERASHGGQFDDRPAYIVKLAEQHQHMEVRTPFPAIDTRALFDALISKSIRTPEDLVLWASQREGDSARPPAFQTVSGKAGPAR